VGRFLLVVGIIIQARMGSTRLPGKVLKKIGNKTLLEHIFFRLKYLQHESIVVVATTTSPHDDAIVQLCIDHGMKYFRGSEKDVLERYYQCALENNFQDIVRLTADNPFTDIEELDNLIDLHLKSKSDYCHSFTELPYGVGAEIFTINALENSFRHGKKSNHREHVNEYIQENQDLFMIRVLNVPSSKNHPEIRLTVDTENDYQRACSIVEVIKKDFITTEDAINECLQ
jgi:spore coat polysaccharide biosynthesis protein SpsF